MSNPPTSHVEPAIDPDAEFFERVVELHRQLHAFMNAAAESLGLTGPQAHALHLFSQPRPMRFAAEAMRCDASYITHIADDLEAMGLAQRSADPHDRRVKQMTLTERGVELHERLAHKLHHENPVVKSLDESERASMLTLLRKLPSIHE